MSLPNRSGQSDAALLRRYVADRDEAAFAALVDRFAGLVYGVALRRAGGDLADEVVQNVFVILARKARGIDASQGLAAWLHKVAGREAGNVARKSQRRERVMERYAKSLGDSENPTSPPADSDLLPVLDEALLALGDRERQLIMLRFFDSLSFREIGKRLGATEEAGRKRVSRALEKLVEAVHLRAGRAVPVASLATLLSASFKTEAPAALVAGVSAPTASSAITALTIMKTSQLAFATTLALAAAIPVAVQWRASANTIEQTTSSFDDPIAAREAVALESVADGSVVAPAAFRTDGQLDLNKLAAALSQVDERGEPADLVFELIAQMFALAEDDLSAAGDLLANAAAASRHLPLLTAYFSRCAEFDPIAAFEDVDRGRWGSLWNIDQGLELGSVQAVALTWAAADPLAALAWCEENNDDLRLLMMPQYTLDQWVVANPPAALAKTREFPADRGVLHRSLMVATWARHQTEEAMEWVRSVEDETERDSLTDALIMATYGQDPDTVFELARQIENPIIRAKGLRNALFTMRYDAEACARAFLALPQEDRSRELTESMLSNLDRELGMNVEPADAERLMREWLMAQEGSGE